MKPVKLFYLKRCPHCKKAIAILEELLKKEEYAEVEITRIEESEHPEIANQYDYYYVPTFYVDEKKICEGILQEKDIVEVLNQAVN